MDGQIQYDIEEGKLKLDNQDDNLSRHERNREVGELKSTD